jgi:hypothetical protein
MIGGKTARLFQKFSRFQSSTSMGFREAADAGGKNESERDV